VLTASDDTQYQSLIAADFRGDGCARGAEPVAFAKEQAMSTMHSARTAGAGGVAASRPNWPSATAKAVACVLVFAALVCAARPASAQFTQQGPKLVGIGAAGGASQGYSVALSADGSTAILGGPGDNLGAGAGWAFSQSGGVWTQQGAKQAGAGEVGAARQGRSIALSADGSTAIVGGYGNNSNAGAAWVFTPGGSVELALGSGAMGGAEQGFSVALSADGNTAIVGGPTDNSAAGAAWVFTQSGGVWTQQGSKLFGSGAVGAAAQGWSVALSADGNTAIVGGLEDNSGAGAVWVFTRSSGVWTPGGTKLPLGSGAVGAAHQGISVALSADGNTAIVGGQEDNSNAGAAWVFTRSSGVWTQQGPKLFGTGAVGAAFQGYAVALSADGNTAIVGGYGDNANAGAAWVFTRSGGGVWTQQGPKLFGSSADGTAEQGLSVALSADGTTAIVGGPNDNSGAGAAWVFTSPSHIAGSLTATPTSGAAPLTVAFRATGLPLPVTYTIDFGDGASEALNQGSCFGGVVGFQCSGSASHTYAAGTYHATLVNASGGTFGAATITAGENLVRPLHPPIAAPASAQFTQQGPKLVGAGAVGTSVYQGVSVALSVDGNTAIVGGSSDNSGAGAGWVFSRSGGVWTQQGSKQVGAGAVGAAGQGTSVALSADGSTAIVGGPGNNSLAGAAWVFTLGGNVELPLGTGAVGDAEQGFSVTLSADGNTAIVGGSSDNADAGAAWVFTQSGGVWSQQGSKLFGGSAVGAAVEQGYSVALSADGNTAIVGGPFDNSGAGAAWVFTRSGGVWTQGGTKLPLGSGAVGVAHQGGAVALSADGNTAIVGGLIDNSGAGAAWVFTRTGGVWTQQGSKLVGNGAVGSSVYQGTSVALSAAGNTAIVGGPDDNANAGAAWVFTRSGGGVWTQQGPKLFGSGAAGAAGQGVSVALSADGTTAIVGGPGDNSNAGAAWVFTAPSHIAGPLTATPTSGSAPLTVAFRATDLPLPMTYTINFGDGTSGALSQGSCFGSKSGVQCSGSASHSYTAGTYDATLVNASGSTLGAATITAGGNLVRPLRPPLLPRGAPPPPSPPVAISTPTPERHSLDR
jgi:PKD repeat protein